MLERIANQSSKVFRKQLNQHNIKLLKVKENVERNLSVKPNNNYTDYANLW